MKFQIDMNNEGEVIKTDWEDLQITVDNLQDAALDVSGAMGLIAISFIQEYFPNGDVAKAVKDMLIAGAEMTIDKYIEEVAEISE